MRILCALVIILGALSVWQGPTQPAHAQTSQASTGTPWTEVWVQSANGFPLYDQLNSANGKLYASAAWANGEDTISKRERRLLTCLSTVYAMIEHSRGSAYLVGAHNYSDTQGSARLTGISESKALDLGVIRSELSSGRPVILWGPIPGDDFGHFVLAIGVNASGEIIAHDPIGAKRIEIDPSTRLVTNSDAISVVTQYRTVEYKGEVAPKNEGQWTIRTDPDHVINLGGSWSGYALSRRGVATFNGKRLGTIPSAGRMSINIYTSPLGRFDLAVLKDEFFGGLFEFMIETQSGDVWQVFTLEDAGKYGLQNEIAWSPDGTLVALPLFQWEGMTSLLVANATNQDRGFVDPLGINQNGSAAAGQFEAASVRGFSWSPKLETLLTLQSATQVEFKVETCNWDINQCTPSALDSRSVEVDFLSGQSDPFASYFDQFLEGELVDMRVASAANRRNYPSTNGTEVLGTLNSGATLTGRWVRDIENERRWLKISTGGYVWEGNLHSSKGEVDFDQYRTIRIGTSPNPADDEAIWTLVRAAVADPNILRRIEFDTGASVPVQVEGNRLLFFGICQKLCMTVEDDFSYSIIIDDVPHGAFATVCFNPSRVSTSSNNYARWFQGGQRVSIAQRDCPSSIAQVPTLFRQATSDRANSQVSSPIAPSNRITLAPSSWYDGGPGCASINPGRHDREFVFRAWYCEAGSRRATPIYIEYDDTISAYIHEETALRIDVVGTGEIKVSAQGSIRDRLGAGVYIADEITAYSRQ